MSSGPSRSGRRSSSTSTAVAAVLFATVLSAAFAEPRRPPATVGSPCDVPAGLEIGLARAPILYAVVDGPSRQVELKAKGVVLRRFPLRGVSSIGRARPETGPSRLITKRPLIEPVPRMPPIPGDATPREKLAEETPLTVGAMPARYRLVFEGGLSMMVRPGGAAARGQRLVEALGAMSDRLGAWATVLAGRLAGVPRRVLILEMTAEEARALYWAVRPPLSVLLRVACPSREPVPGAALRHPRWRG